MKLSKKIVSAVTFSLSAFCFYSESFRVRKIFPVEIHADASHEHTIMTGINDSLALYFPEDKTFLEGVELKLSIPAKIAEWRDSVAFSIYDNITPNPASSQIDYSGTRIYVTPLPSKLSWNVLIPITEKNDIKEGSYNTTKVNVIPDLKNNFSFCRFQPAMKGIPEEAMDAELKISVKAILINKGRLNLSVSTYDNAGKPYSIYIDDVPYSSSRNGWLIDTGMHTLSIQSENYRSETRSLFIEQAKDTNLEIRLQSLEPTLKIQAPANAEIILDDTKISPRDKEMIIQEGEHIIKCHIGDYEIQRKLDVQKGKSYSVNLTVDLQVSEE